MPIPVTCASCGTRLQAKDSAAGRDCTCPNCRALIPVPASAQFPIAPKSRTKPPDPIVTPAVVLSVQPVGDLAKPTTDCPYCGEEILAVAKKCKHCGETLDVALRTAQEAKRDAEAARRTAERRSQPAVYMNAGGGGGGSSSSSSAAAAAAATGRGRRGGCSLVGCLGLLGLFWLVGSLVSMGQRVTDSLRPTDKMPARIAPAPAAQPPVAQPVAPRPAKVDAVSQPRADQQERIDTGSTSDQRRSESGEKDKEARAKAQAELTARMEATVRLENEAVASRKLRLLKPVKNDIDQKEMEVLAAESAKKLALQAELARLKESYKDALSRIIRNHPDTQAATEAKQLLQNP